MAPTTANFEASARATELLDEMPPWAREDPDLRAMVYVWAKEGELMEATLNAYILELYLATATAAGLRNFEILLSLPIEPAGLTDEQRRGIIAAHMLAAVSGTSGAQWVENLNAIVSGGWSYQEHIPIAMRRSNLASNPKAGAGATTGWTNAGLTTFTNGAVPSPTTEMTEKGLTTGFHGVGNAALQRAWLGFPVENGKSYIASVYVFPVSTPSGGPLLLISNTAGASIGNAPQIADDGAWVRTSYAFTADQTGTWRAELSLSASAAIDFWWTGLLIEEGTEVKDYVDGDLAGYEWLGSPESSISRQSSPAADTIRVILPFLSSTPEFVRAAALLREMTPAHKALEITSGSGLFLDQGHLDQDKVQ